MPTAVAVPSDAMYEALDGADSDDFGGTDAGGTDAGGTDAPGMYAAPTVAAPTVAAPTVAAPTVAAPTSGFRDTVYELDFLGGGVSGEQALYDAAGGGYAYGDTESFAGFSGAVRMSGGYSEPRPIMRLPSARAARVPAVPDRPSLKGPGVAPSGAAAVPGWVKAVLVLYGVLLCVAFGLLGDREPSVRTVEQSADDIAETAHEIVDAVQTVATPPGFVGQVGFFATTIVPPGWIVCDGRAVDVADFPALAAALGAGANATAFRVPDMVSGGGLFPRGGLTPGVVQEQSVAVDDLSATVEVWDYANPSTVVPWLDPMLPARDPDAPRRQTVRQFWYDRTRTRETDIGLWPYTFPVNFTAGGGNETRPPAIVLVPAIYAGGA